MEAAGVALGVAEVIGRLTAITGKLYHDFKNAESDRLALKRHFELLSITATFLTRVEDEVKARARSSSSPGNNTEVNALLENVRCALQGCLGKYSEFERTYIVSSPRIIWTLKGRRKGQELLGMLKDLHFTTSTALQLLNIQLGCQSDALSKQSVTQVDPHNSQKAPGRVQLAPSWSPIPVGDVLSSPCHIDTRSEQSLIRVSRWRPITPFLGLSKLQIGFSSIRQRTFKYRFFVGLSLPFPAENTRFMWTVHLDWYLPLINNTYGFSASIRIQNVIPSNSPIVEACRSGNVEVVKTLFYQAMASPSDITHDLRSLLWHAIQSRSLEMVQFLIEQGADVNYLSGEGQTELLSTAFHLQDVEISRLLLFHGVEYDHVNNFGTTALFYAYQPTLDMSSSAFQSSSKPRKARELFELLLCRGFTTINVQSVKGWTILHRAAAYGNAEDIDYLLRYGGDASIRTNAFFWPPIFVAATFGNLETFRVLANIYTGQLATDTDRVGWTLLHHSVYGRNIDIMSYLLQHGSCPHALTFPTTMLETSIPEDLRGVALTPGAIANWCGPETLAAYDVALRRQNYEVLVDQDGDVFWDFEYPAVLGP